MTLTKEEKRYGPANTWAVLHLDSAADSRDIISVCGELKRHLSGSKSSLGQILLANDEVLERNQKELKKAGVVFFPDWKEPEGTYKRMLSAAEEHGNVYEMKHLGDCYTFSYRERDSDDS